VQIVEPTITVNFHWPGDGSTVEQFIEKIGRTCYKSEAKITEDSADSFVRKLIKNGHHAVLEFGYATAKIIADRGLTHELVRHRLCSFAQESTRYCDYSKGKFNASISVIRPPGLDAQSEIVWRKAMYEAEKSYFRLRERGMRPEIARSVLPIGIKSEINVGANLREWRHIFSLRCSKKAHPTIRYIMLDALAIFHDKAPIVFEDLADLYLKKED
jgi:thymidylate synthase (FAD)